MKDRVKMLTDAKVKTGTPKTLIRRLLMLSGIGIVAVVSGWLYITSGRFIATDNAYIKAAKTLVTPQVSGEIVAVYITDNQPVSAGTALFKIDPSSYLIAVEKAKADLAQAKTEVEKLKALLRQKTEDMERAKIDAAYQESEYQRKKPLSAKGNVSASTLDEAKRLRDLAYKNVGVLREEINGILAALEGNATINTSDHPLYRKALANLHDAELNLDRTTVTALNDAVVGSAPHVGDFARVGVPILNMVKSHEVWIEANYKETELTNVKPGQSVAIAVDTYPDHHWIGQVESISPATGSEFSILPAQNATGNWVKVVQRIAVRINLVPGPVELALRTGMSTHVSIDTQHYPNGFGLLD